MFKLRSGLVPKSVAVSVMRVGMCTTLLMLGACASRQAQHRAGPQYAAHPQARVAGYTKVARRVQIEDDGIEAQAAPPQRIRNEPDDPTEPFSPNYGRASPVADATGAASDADGLDDDPNAYDPFLDDPQWSHNDFQATSPRAALRPRKLRTGFRRKRANDTARATYSTSMR